MTSALLGLRLAITPAARIRSALLVLAATLVTVVLLATAAAGRYELTYSLAYQAEMPRLVAAAVAAIILPCAVLLATVARLSAALRDRRLANLRLIGLTPAQTRLVGTTETGAAAALGAVLGWLAFWLVRPVLVDHPFAGRSWDQPFGPNAMSQVLVLVGVPAVVVLAGLVPTRTTSREPLAVARRADRTPPGWWRLAPLVAGAALCTVLIVRSERRTVEATNRDAVLFMVGSGLLALGLVLVLPALVRLLTRALTGLPLGPAGRVAVRRLEAQPAGVARIIGALLIGLFLVTGARYVLVAFESTPQYQQAERLLTVQDRVAVDTTAGRADQVVAELRATEGVDGVVDLATLHSGRGLEAIVATCDQVAALDAGIQGCVDGEPMWFGSAPRRGRDIDWRSGGRAGNRGDDPVVATTPASMAAMGETDTWASLSPVYADVVLPPALVGDLPDSTRHTVLVVGPPGGDLADRLSGTGYGMSYSGTEEYDFVATMRTIIWTIAAVVLGVGLLSLMIATIDRAIQRRKEMVGLRLVGLGAGPLRRAQLFESAVPLTLGIAMAIGLGALAGGTFLSLDGTLAVPWDQTWRLLGAAVLGGLVVAAVCTAAAVPRLRPEEIRAE